MSEQTGLLARIKTHEDLCALSMAELETLAGEVRQVIKQTVSNRGGHLASNLGVVELTIALHRVFDFTRDRLCLDVGHQCYVHKLLTGRVERFGTLRQQDGISGFPSPAESPADPFYVGHAGTAIASALGLALGAQMRRSDEKVVALVGDASIVNGLSFEGLNNTTLLKRQFLIILNDNSMAIDTTQGAFADYLTHLRLSRPYEDLRRRTKILVRAVPFVGPELEERIKRFKDGVKTTLLHRQIFEQLGIPYFGTVDGHDIAALIELLKAFKDMDHPVMLHVQTEKGKGFAPAAQDPCLFHSPQPFDMDGETARIVEKGETSFTAVFAQSLLQEMRKDERVVAITAAMPDGTGLARVREEFPARVLDVGICESAAVDIAAGMAKQGLKPVVAIYSTFLQRSFDQVFQEVSLQNLPVVFCLDRAGMVGGDGAVHHGFCDIAFLRCLPNLVLMAPADQAELAEALRFALASGRPCAVRYPRDAAMPGQAVTPAFEPGRATRWRGGQDGAILAYGTVAQEALAAADELAGEGIEVALYSARFAKPLDEELLRELLERQGQWVLTVEDHALAGGFGAAVLESVERLALPAKRLVRLGLPDRFIGHGSRRSQMAEAGIDAAAIAARVRDLVGGKKAAPGVRPRPTASR